MSIQYACCTLCWILTPLSLGWKPNSAGIPSCAASYTQGCSFHRKNESPSSEPVALFPAMQLLVPQMCSPPRFCSLHLIGALERKCDLLL